MLSETISQLEIAYIKLNEALFNNELPSVCITIQHETKKSKNTVLGWFSTLYVWKDSNNTEMFEINITPDALGMSTVDIIGTLIHEMVHLYCMQNNITDCTGRKHTEEFKDACERVGLICEKDKSVGWGMTSVGSSLYETIINLELDEDAFGNSCEKVVIPSEPKKKKIQPTYVCPSCKEKLKSKSSTLVIMCVKCNMQFQLLQQDEDSN